MRPRTVERVALFAALGLVAGCRLEIHEVAPMDDPDDAGARDRAEAVGDGADGEEGEAVGCEAGLLSCGDECVDPLSDRDHCGGCDRSCGVRGDCTGGQCACPEGLAACAGTCVRLDRDPLHCGACGAACGVGEACRRGVCVETPAADGG